MAISAVLLVAVVVMVGIGIGIARSAGEAPAAVDYPVVEGDLGRHLDQLQRSVDE